MVNRKIIELVSYLNFGAPPCQRFEPILRCPELGLEVVPVLDVGRHPGQGTEDRSFVVGRLVDLITTKTVFTGLFNSYYVVSHYR